MSGVGPRFDEQQWKLIIQQPDWYLRLIPYVKQVHHQLEPGSPEYNEFNYTVRHFFEKALQEGRVALADSGPDLDEERMPADTIVIHHTSNKKSYRLSYLNAVHLLNIYATYYANPRDNRDTSLEGRPIWSGHFYHGRQVFWGYHWMMRMDGSFERLLDDDKVGWHAGNWDINRRSIGICLDNDYEGQDPTEEVLQKLAAHIKLNYPAVKPSGVIGHCEARQGTICPGGEFMGGWKDKLLEYLADGP